MKIIVIGTYPPRQCGIATFTSAFSTSLEELAGDQVDILAISDGTEEGFPKEVKATVAEDDESQYAHAAEWISSNYDCCILQHEFGIFGGASGGHILELITRLRIPLITNLHTVVPNPSSDEKRVMTSLLTASSKLTVMSQRAVSFLIEIYGAKSDKIQLIRHGVPSFTLPQERAKSVLGLQGKKVMLSFGFLGQGKGYETAIQAVSYIPDPNFLYIILGSTHPNILREEGESYRHFLQDQVTALGATERIKFIDCFASETLLKSYLSACDMFVTPYPNENQISSGTLSFALAAGTAVLSTPYWYARDVLQGDRGLLFPFGDAKSLANHIGELLSDRAKLVTYRTRAKQFGATMSWKNIAKEHHDLVTSLLKIDGRTRWKKEDKEQRNGSVSRKPRSYSSPDNLINPNS